MASLVRINERQLPAVFRSFHTARICSLLLPSCREISARMDCSSYSANHLRRLPPTRFQETIGVTLESCGGLEPAIAECGASGTRRRTAKTASHQLLA
eukprot:scaffold85152_cov48-Phaeocystis_antarctica.AAC.1